MKYLFGEVNYHFFDLSESSPTRFVYDTDIRSIIMAEMLFDGLYYPASEAQLSDLEAGVLTIPIIESLTPAEILPKWALSCLTLIPMVDEDTGENMNFRLRDVKSMVEGQIALLPGARVGVDPLMAMALIGVIERLLVLVPRGAI